MAKFAEKTTVPVEKSRAEIERTLERYGADQFIYGRDDDLGKATIRFRAHGRYVQFAITLPNRNDKQFTEHSRGRRNTDAALKAWEQGCRQIWRALALCIKAKLEAIETGICEFEDEFLAHIVLPDKSTTGQWLRPQLSQCYESGKMPKSLLALPAPEMNGN